MDRKTQSKWKGTTGGGNFGQKFLLWFLHYFDVRVLYGILYVIIPFYMIFRRSAYIAIRDYFRFRMKTSFAKAVVATYKNHLLFAQMMMDRFSLLSGHPSRFQVEVEGQDLFTAYTQQEKGFMIAGSHVGNFEICGYLMQQNLKDIYSLVYAGESALMQHSRSQTLQQHHTHLIPVKEDLSHLFALKAALDSGQVVSMACDRLMENNKRLDCSFLGAPATFSLGPFLIASQLGVDMIALFAFKDSIRKYHLYVCPIPCRKASEMAQEYVHTLEKMVEKYPLQWFNFYDFWNEN